MRRILPSALSALVLTMVLAPSALVPTASPAQAQQHHHEVFKPDALKWIDAPTFPGAKLAIMHGDPGKEGLFVYRVKFPANYKVPPHFHKASESVTVLSGVFFIGAGEKFDHGAATEVPVGGFVFIPPTHPHFAWAGGQEALIQVHGVGPTDITFVNPADDPRKK